LAFAKLAGADLSGADLQYASLVRADLTGADLTGCRIYGISAWGLELESAKQQNLIITPPYEPEITADDIEVGQFLYLIFTNRKIRRVVDTITSKVVLILGRFTDERKAVLDALRCGSAQA
jgi:pentapeptide repeat protein